MPGLADRLGRDLEAIIAAGTLVTLEERLDLWA
jgi:hypothetical protein